MIYFGFHYVLFVRIPGISAGINYYLKLDDNKIYRMYESDDYKIRYMQDLNGQWYIISDKTFSEIVDSYKYNFSDTLFYLFNEAERQGFLNDYRVLLDYDYEALKREVIRNEGKICNKYPDNVILKKTTPKIINSYGKVIGDL